MSMIYISSHLIRMAFPFPQNTNNITEKGTLVFQIKESGVVFTTKDYLVKNLGAG
jgi:hypothetical protein